MTRVVSDEGVLALPLYHGTSTFFWPSIQEHGLGGKSIVEEWRLIPLLRESLTVLQSIDDEHVRHEMRLRLPILSSIAEQRVSGGGFNWRHGSVYLTFCSWKAVSYAGRGFGSELLGQVAETMDLVENVRPGIAAELGVKYPEFAAARCAEHSPVLIRIDQVSLARLRDEGGDDPQGALELAETFVGMGDTEPQVSFELIGAIPAGELTAAKIQVTEWKYGIPKVWTSTPLT
jgi:hypothetical protein